MKLYIGNKNYSSWSFRAWLAMTVKGIPFEEDLRPFQVLEDFERFFEFSPTGKVPALLHDGVTVYESLAILEYLADLYPDKGFWPEDRIERSHARCISSEMHAGFPALRNDCPMNMRRPHSAIEVSAALQKDVHRVESIWDECLQRSGGPFLFGEFSNADAMFAPVVNRLEIYMLSEHDAVIAYREAMQALPAWQAWEAAGRAENWYAEFDEA